MPPIILALMSGGVDSSAAAAILLQQKFDVIGITMKVWEDAEAPVVPLSVNPRCADSGSVSWSTARRARNAA